MRNKVIYIYITFSFVSFVMILELH